MADQAAARRPSGRTRVHWLALTLLLLALALLLVLDGVTQDGARTGSRSATGGPRPDVRDGHAVVVVGGAPGSETRQVLDLLARQHVRATFALVGARVDDDPGLVRRMRAGGHEVAVTSFTGASLRTLPSWRRRLEVNQSQLALAAATGRTTALLWTAAGEGSEVLLPGGTTKRPGTAQALGDLVEDLRAQGYVFDTYTQAMGVTDAWRPATTTQVLGGRVVSAALAAARALVTLLGIVVLVVLALAALRTVFLLLLAGLHAYAQWRQGPSTWPATGLPPVSVVVPATTGTRHLAETVTSLVQGDYPVLEVVVVLDAADTETAARITGLGYGDVRTIGVEGALVASALDAGIAQAQHPVVVLVDADTVVEPAALGALVDPLLDPVHGPGTGAVAGNAEIANRDRLLGRWEHLEHAAGPSLDQRAFDVLQCAPIVPDALGAFRREALDAVGGASRDTLLERTDLTMAIARAGWRVAYAPRARARTTVPTTWSRLWRWRFRQSYGTLQATWKHRRAVREGGAAGRLGRRGLPYLLAFQLLLPLVAPAIDVAALHAIATGTQGWVLQSWVAFLVLQLLGAAVALRLDDEPVRPLWSLPLQQLVYRQLMYLVVVQAAVRALAGPRPAAAARPTPGPDPAPVEV